MLISLPPTCLSLLLTLLPCFVFSQAYTSYFTGDTSDVSSSNIQAGIVLAGGGPDQDEAMRWMLQRAGGGDVLVLRASGSDGYNDYFFQELGVAVNSVETIKFNNAAAATDPYVLRRIQEAELIFFAGGNQSDYVNYWRGNSIAAALNEAINQKRITIGGTSAGMAILGQLYYAPTNQSLVSMEALSNPFHANTNGFSQQPFLQLPFLEDSFTDTHFEQRNRQGRAAVLLGRATALIGQGAKGIAANEATAICVDELGIARVFGDTPNFPDYAFFFQVGCTDANFMPENMVANQAFTWNRSGSAISVYRVPGTSSGTHSFDLSNWAAGSGGDWQYWWAANGIFYAKPNGNPPSSCSPSSNNELSLWQNIQLAPSITQQQTQLIGHLPPLRSIRLLALDGRSLASYPIQQRSFDLSQVPRGVYLLQVYTTQGAQKVWKVVKE